ncbi:MAG: endonuclease V [Acidobacteriota bacterium]|nr:MAG: endonuclease V [Acidobacteriota bacterium]
MTPDSLALAHHFPQSLEGAAALQQRLAAMVRERPLPDRPARVAGADLSYDAARGLLFAAVVVLDGRDGRLLETGRHVGPVRVPYVPGFLSFREGPAILAALAQLSAPPDVLLCDGQGRAHPRRFGLACHLGVATGLPTVGVAKSRLCGTFRPPGRRRGCRTRLVDRGEIVGAVLRTRDGVRPLFVSVGHLVTLDDACRLVLRWARGLRLPEPVRLADREVARMRRASGPATAG